MLQLLNFLFLFSQLFAAQWICPCHIEDRETTEVIDKMLQIANAHQELDTPLAALSAPDLGVDLKILWLPIEKEGLLEIGRHQIFINPEILLTSEDGAAPKEILLQFYDPQANLCTATFQSPFLEVFEMQIEQLDR